ncbi:Protein DOWNY MILDEW RESISTANCE 6 [Cardamine amara subsp. amara]|uniref:Protein DOWNY MILDEW RESISTANCE 6 n=1 Tax=Cardamine amara subsp. amara TaxID=228776 RepID=A0ABD0Z076_CARAN
MASSSAHLDHHQLPNMHCGATAAPPPTPSCTHPNTTSKSETAADALSRLFHRLPPNLSLPNRRSASAASSISSLPTVSLSAGDQRSRDNLISAATDFGYFQLTNDDSDIITPSGLAEAAESDSLSLLELSEEIRESSFPKNWPLGYEADAETPSFCLNVDCSTESSELELSSLREFTRTLEKVGLKMVEMLASALGFGYDSTRFNTLMWLNQGVPDDKPEITNGFYPFVVCLQYQIREQKYCLLTESGWVSVFPRVDSVLVTLGDIAQVWRNGEVKRVRYRPVLCSGQIDDPRKCVTMTLMITLPMDTMVSPLKDISDEDTEETYGEKEEEEENGEARTDDIRAFRSFFFEDYAWRVYHERLFFNDPLDRYRIKS